jgi:hypothetical protein
MSDGNKPCIALWEGTGNTVAYGNIQLSLEQLAEYAALPIDDFGRVTLRVTVIHNQYAEGRKPNFVGYIDSPDEPSKSKPQPRAAEPKPKATLKPSPRKAPHSGDDECPPF